MLTQDILAALKQYTQSLSKTVTFVLQSGTHSKRAELVDFLNQVASTSEKLVVEERDNTGLRSPMSFYLSVDGKRTGIIFSGIPAGHEFNSLILAVIQSGGSEIKLDAHIKKLIAQLKDPIHFEVFVSLGCHNCPDVVQVLNQFAMLNDNITTEMIDGGLYPKEISDRDIQGVPSVYLNGHLFANGKVDAAQLVENIIAAYPYVIETASEQNEYLLPLQDVTVIGGGPAGVSAAIYSARKGLKVTLITDRLGGQVKDTMAIENLIGIQKTTGPELVNSLQAHLADYDITIKEHLRVEEISKGAIKTLKLSSGEKINAKTIIMATGARWRELGVPGEKENIGNGVAYCPHCDGPFFKGKNVAVIGGGNSGIEAALDLAGIVQSVTVYEYLSELKADDVLVEQAKSTHNIQIRTNVATQEIRAANDKVSGLVYQDRDSGEIQEHALDGVFVQIGLLPNSQVVKETLTLSSYGEIIINERCETSEPGIYACGDVTTVPYKQIVVAMGEGAKASLSAFEYLLKQRENPQDNVSSLVA